MFKRRPAATAALFFLIDEAIALGAGALVKAFAPHADAALIAVVVLTVWVAALLTTLGWWRTAGFNGVAEWRNLKLLWPAAIIMVLIPVLGGFKWVDPGTLATLGLGYALTAVYEEGFFRGFLLRVLRPIGARRAIFLAAVLFGMAHLTNLFFRSDTSPAVTVFQAIGAFSFGVGEGALFLLTGTLWPLMLFHFGEDFLLHVGRLPILLVNPIQSVLMLAYGLYLMRYRWHLVPSVATEEAELTPHAPYGQESNITGDTELAERGA